MIISHKTQSLDYGKDVNDLLCQIDVELGSQAKNKLDSDRFGAKICVNEDDFKLLAMYRKILLDKTQNDCCLRDYLIDDIISRIKQLLNRN